MLKLFTKSKIGNMTLKNRIFLGPMSARGESDGSYKLSDADYMEERAKGGAGLLFTGMNIVSSKYEDRPSTELSHYNHVENLAILTERCHHHGAKVAVQLSPGLGRITFTDPFTPPHAASECESFWFPGLKCKPLQVDEIHDLADRMGYAANLAKTAGADAVEIHAYGGYLLDQFQAAIWNKRTDEYGGSLKNRMRFTLECIESIRRNTENTLPVIVKFTAYHGIDGGIELQEGIKMAEIFEESGVDALHVDVGCYDTWYKAVSTVYSEEGHQLKYAKAVKDAVNIPVLGHGKLTEPALTERALTEGYLDFVGIAHGLLADPYWPDKVRNGRIYDIVPCIGCNECLANGLAGKRYYCAVNPLCSAEKDYALPETSAGKKSVLVVGGGPGGMTAAATAADRGFEVELWEKSGRLGGNLLAAGKPYFKEDIRKYKDYLVTQLHRKQVRVRLYKEGYAEEIIAGNYDKVILATGSMGRKPEIPGVEYAKSYEDVFRDSVECVKQAVVIGGGLIGCETALYLKEKTGRVVLMVRGDDILTRAGLCRNNEQHLRKMLADSEIEVVNNAHVIKIDSDHVTYEKEGKTHSIHCDQIVLATGSEANNPLEDMLEGKVKSLSVIGDAVRPRRIMEAVHEAYHAIRLIPQEL